jgi:excisionase family DNA binding protein
VKNADHDRQADSGLPVLLLTAQQVADLCQVSVDTVYRWSYERDFPVVMLSDKRHIRVHARKLDEWLQRKAESGRPIVEEEVA